MSIDTIDRYISELEAIKNYEQVKKERDEALKRADPKIALQDLIQELKKPESEQKFPKELIDSGLVRAVDELIKEEVNRRVDIHWWWHEYVDPKKTYKAR